MKTIISNTYPCLVENTFVLNFKYSILFLIFISFNTYAQTNASSIQSSFSIQWSDNQTLKNDPASIMLFVADDSENQELYLLVNSSNILYVKNLNNKIKKLSLTNILGQTIVI